MKTNEDLQKDVQNAIGWEPLLDEAEIGVIAKDGIITLTGTVDSFWKKTEAAGIAWKAPGVWSVDNELVVDYEYELAD
jgi:osmotically-inducible protein OsmY